MPFEIPPDLPASMYPLAWLVGSWRGEGVIEYPTLQAPISFHQLMQISHEGQDYLTYRSRMTKADDGALLEVESGFWRVPDSPQDSPPSGASMPRGVSVEVLVVHPTGIAEIYLGSARAGTVEMATDMVARTSTAGAYNAARRMYGRVDGHLLWVLEVAAHGNPMTSYSSARLSRIDPEVPDAPSSDSDE